MNFQEVALFFEGWGLFPSDEDPVSSHPDLVSNEGAPYEFNKEVTDQGLNFACYVKMRKEARALDADLYAFIPYALDATDDAWYLTARTWKALEHQWATYIAQWSKNPSR